MTSRSFYIDDCDDTDETPNAAENAGVTSNHRADDTTDETPVAYILTVRPRIAGGGGMSATRETLQARWRDLLHQLSTTTDPAELEALGRELIDLEAQASALVAGTATVQGTGDGVSR